MTIVNLRNEKRTGWYRDDADAAKRAGVILIDFPISSDRELPITESAKLARLMTDARKPILIHCEHGANRTGLAAAIYVGAVKRSGESFADFQLSPFYGHIPIPGIGRYAMSKSWIALRKRSVFDVSQPQSGQAGRTRNFPLVAMLASPGDSLDRSTPVTCAGT
jgi:protein tyrosine/serine phosphatase